MPRSFTPSIVRRAWLGGAVLSLIVLGLCYALAHRTTLLQQALDERWGYLLALPFPVIWGGVFWRLRSIQRRVRSADLVACTNCLQPLKDAAPSGPCPSCRRSYDLCEVRGIWKVYVNRERLHRAWAAYTMATFRRAFVAAGRGFHREFWARPRHELGAFPPAARRIYRVHQILAAVLMTLVFGLIATTAIGPSTKTSCILASIGPIALNSAILLWRQSRLKRHAKETEFLLCPDCLYWLRGLATSGRCPECGSPFDVSEVQASWKNWLENS